MHISLLVSLEAIKRVYIYKEEGDIEDKKGICPGIMSSKSM